MLVLDDYHVITEQAIHNAFASFIERLPPRVHVVLITRAEPPVRLSRLRGRDHVLEVRTDHLRWTAEEAGAFLETSMGTHLEPREIEQVTARTEGWVMGLQFFALSLRGYATPQPLLERMSGKERYILDYLSEEVLQQQPEATQRFLLQTSILTQLTASLCDHVTQQTGSQALLERLERENVFLTALDRERRWYRYHVLFAETLRVRLERGEEPQTLIALHQRASDWYAEHDYLKEAVEHAIQAQDWPRALDLMESAVQKLPKGRKGSPSLLPWLSQVPTSAVYQRPRLCLFFARVLLLSARFQEAFSWLDAAEAKIDAELAQQRSGSAERGAKLSPVRSAMDGTAW